MEIGAYIRTWRESTIKQAFEKMSSQGIYIGQFNMSCVGEATLPSSINREKINMVRQSSADYNIHLFGLSGTFNIIYACERDFDHFLYLLEIAQELSIPYITICTGTYCKKSMWLPDIKNQSSEAWSCMLRAIERLLLLAESAGIIIGIEPEPSNIVSNAFTAKRLLEHFNTEFLKIVMDGANLLSNTTREKQPIILTEAFRLLSPDIICVHCKDFDSNGKFVAAGKGNMDYPLYLKLLKGTNYKGPLLLHQLSPEEVPGSVDFIRKVEQLIAR